MLLRLITFICTVHFVTEIQSMMHGFGDSRSPLIESATLIQTVVLQQMRTIIHKASEVSIMRGVKAVGPEDIIFLMRKDRVRLHRLLKYLGIVDILSILILHYNILYY